MASSMLSVGVQRAVGAVPRLARPFLGRPPVNDRGVELDAEVYGLLRIAELAGRPTFDELGPDRARVEYRDFNRLVDVPLERLARVEDRVIDGPQGPIPARVYWPRQGGEPLPALMFLHGGGFVIGDLESHDRICRFFAKRANVAVIAIDYRLAPEHPFPAAVIDSLAAFRWLAEHAAELKLDPSRLAIGGDSAGGNLSAVVCQQLDADEPRPAFQLLIYPGTDLTRSCDSVARFEEGFLLTRPVMDWFLANYLTSPSQQTDPRASPLVTADLAGLPPAHVVVAGFDPLRDEGEAYAKNLVASGVHASLRCYGSLVHGFATMGGIFASARWACEDMAAALARGLSA